MVNVTMPTTVPNLKVCYVLFLPNGKCWIFDRLDQPTTPWEHNVNSLYWDQGTLFVPLDLITAAQLKLIKPGDNSGIGDEQWAWIKLIGLVGESG